VNHTVTKFDSKMFTKMFENWTKDCGTRRCI